MDILSGAESRNLADSAGFITLTALYKKLLFAAGSIKFGQPHFL